MDMLVQTENKIMKFINIVNKITGHVSSLKVHACIFKQINYNSLFCYESPNTEPFKTSNVLIRRHVTSYVTKQEPKRKAY